jgi:hypothetical protein
MPAIYLHRSNPAPGIISADLFIDNTEDMGRGRLAVAVEPAVFNRPETVRATLVNLSELTVTIELAAARRHLEITLEHRQPPQAESTKRFILCAVPPDLPGTELEICFQQDEVTTVTLNGELLQVTE